MAQFQRHFVQDLTKPIPIRQCGDLGFSGDNLSDVISVDLYTDGEPYSGGGTCAGACICPDGSTVALSGSVSGKTASVSLTEDCFAISGQIDIGIRVTSGTTKTTVLKAIYNVEQFATNNPVDPGSRISLDVDDLITRINTAVESIPASADQLKAAMAPTFSENDPYEIGDYVWNDGNLYRFIAAHSPGTWVGAEARQIALGTDFRSLTGNLPTYIGNRVSVPGDFAQYRTFQTGQYALPSTANMPKSTIYNIADYLQSSTIDSAVTYPIQIRDANGGLIYDITFDNGTATSGVQCVYYDKAGNYVSYLNAPNFDPESIPATAYFIVFRIYYNKGQTLEITPKNNVEFPAWLTISGETVAEKFSTVEDDIGTLGDNLTLEHNEAAEKIYTVQSATGIEQTDYYSGLYSLSYEEALLLLKAANTSGTWNDNVYATTGGGTITVNQDLTFAVDNSQSSGSAVLWLPYFQLASGEHVYIINRSNVRCTLYKASTNSGNVTNGVLEYTADSAGDYRMAVRAEAGASGTIPHLMVTKVLPLSYQVQSAVDRITDIENGFVYNVGAGLDFATYTACIKALQGDNRVKTIYIHSGTYDVFDETGGAAYWGTFTGNENDWRQYNDIIPPNTTIIGVGDVNLNFMPSGTGTGAISEDASHVASPVNVSGTCTLENLTINADNCRYALHVETSGIADFIGSVYTFKNVRVNRYTTYFTTNRYKHNDALACGFDDEMRIEFDNCALYADTNGTPFRFHDRGTARATITANNCVIRGNGSNRSMIRLEDVSSSTDAHTFFGCNGCFIGGRVHLVKSSGNRNPYDITLLNCGNPAIDIDSGMENPYTPNVYNQYVYSDDGTGNITII